MQASGATCTYSSSHDDQLHKINLNRPSASAPSLSKSLQANKVKTSAQDFSSEVFSSKNTGMESQRVMSICEDSGRKVCAAGFFFYPIIIFVPSNFILGRSLLQGFMYICLMNFPKYFKTFNRPFISHVQLRQKFSLQCLIQCTIKQANGDINLGITS